MLVADYCLLPYPQLSHSQLFRLCVTIGICVVPGSGFGQRADTYHFRTTFLPPEDEIDEVIARMSKFHAAFMRKYTPLLRFKEMDEV